MRTSIRQISDRAQRTAAAGPLALAFALALALAACGPASTTPSSPARPSTASGADVPAGTAPATPIPMIVSYSNITPDIWAVWVAADEGLFTRHGLDVDLRLIESSTGVAAIMTGEVQAGALGGSEVMAAAAEGADLAIIGAITRYFSYRFMVPPTIRSAEGLRGQRIGVSRYGSTSDIATRLTLQRLNLVPGQDVEVIQVGSVTARMQAFESGAIQGALAQPPETQRLIALGAHVLVDLGDLDLMGASGAIVVRRSALVNSRPQLQRLIDAIADAIAYIRTEPAAAKAVMARWMKYDDPDALEEAWQFYVNKVLPPEPRFVAGQLESSKQVMAAQSERIANYDINQLIDSSLVDSAVARGIGVSR